MEDFKTMRIRLSNRVIEGRRMEKETSAYWDETRELQKEVWLKEHGLSIGDDVEINNGGNWERGRLSGMTINWSEAKPIINKFKKDGSISLKNHYIGYKPEIRKFIPEPPAPPLKG